MPASYHRQTSTCVHLICTLLHCSFVSARPLPPVQRYLCSMPTYTETPSHALYSPNMEHRTVQAVFVASAMQSDPCYFGHPDFPLLINQAHWFQEYDSVSPFMQWGYLPVSPVNDDSQEIVVKCITHIDRTDFRLTVDGGWCEGTDNALATTPASATYASHGTCMAHGMCF